MAKIIWFGDKKHTEFEPFFVIAEKITDVTALHASEGEQAELSIGLIGNGSRWRATPFNTNDAVDEAINSIAEIILDKRSGNFGVSIEDGTWQFLED